MSSASGEIADQKQQASADKHIAILSIDRGGIKGIILAITLACLEMELQYFNVITGTSTVGLVTAMLTAPNELKRPFFAARDIKDSIWNKLDESCFSSCSVMTGMDPFTRSIKSTKAFIGPKYDGKKVHKKIKELLGGTTISQTLANVVIFAFDIKNLQPTIFSSFEVSNY
ncbi:unnamed protein product [Spirodela intermedia]|uniref:Patatin n=1 Tax=Spirodela intermedia TaxID=51605 RepID=A0A7I8IMV2_SPIIN|nr:unnamed protein product [Spirodela intermedia]CAA6659294.1 unnamed protein product [Spirodela intermedia]